MIERYKSDFSMRRMINDWNRVGIKNRESGVRKLGNRGVRELGNQGINQPAVSSQELDLDVV